MEYQRIEKEVLNTFVTQVFEAQGFSDEASQNAARILVLSDLRGVESHGVARLHGYIRQVDEGKINPMAKPFIEREKYGTLTLNADRGLGLYVATKAAELADEKAGIHGSGWVAVKNSSHFGVAIGHILPLIEKNRMALSMTNASPLVAPAGGIERLLGTNPICIGIPAATCEPFILDMATTVVANGKLEVAKRKGAKIPEGYAQSKEGQVSTDPTILSLGGSMIPLGSQLSHSSYKGYGLGAVVDILCGVLSGANFGPWVPPFVPFLNAPKQTMGDGIGHFVGAWAIDGFMESDEFLQRMDIWIKRFSESTPAPGVDQVLIPGQKEATSTKEKERDGIPIYSKVWTQLEEIDKRFGLKILV